MRRADLEKQLAALKRQLAALVKQFTMRSELLPAVRRKRDELVSLCKKAGIPIRVTSGFRSIAEQDALYAQGRTKPGSIVTNAKGGQSLHNYGVAFDVCFASPTPYVGDWELVGRLGESIGLEWGGRWTGLVDKPHFQLMHGYTLRDFQRDQVDYLKYV